MHSSAAALFPTALGVQWIEYVSNDLEHESDRSALVVQKGHYAERVVIGYVVGSSRHFFA